MEEKRWYAVHTYSGYENKVKTNLEKRIESMNMEEFIFRIMVPTEDIIAEITPSIIYTSLTLIYILLHYIIILKKKNKKMI